MILQALTDYYHVLEREGKIAAPGWGPVKVSFALELGDDGTLEQVIPIQTQQQRGKKTVLAPQSISLPAPVKRASRRRSQFSVRQFRLYAGHRRQGQASAHPGVLRRL